MVVIAIVCAEIALAVIIAILTTHMIKIYTFFAALEGAIKVIMQWFV